MTIFTGILKGSDTCVMPSYKLAADFVGIEMKHHPDVGN
jgi:hypothetical protein